MTALSAGTLSAMQIFAQRPSASRTIGWIIAAAAVVLAVAWLVFVPVPDWLASHDVGNVAGAVRILQLQTARDAARGQLLTLCAGLFAIGALVFTARNFTLSRDGQVTDRYTKAIEQLGSEKLDVRIGGIYALERIAQDSTKDHPTVMEVLAAFVREHSREPLSLSSDKPRPDTPGPRPDVQAALTVIGRRDIRRDRLRIDLSNADLTAVLLTGARLRGAIFHSATLVGADLDYADLSFASFIGADLSGAFFIDAILAHADLSGAKFAGTYLSRADLTGAKFGRVIHPGDDLSGMDLTGGTLTVATLTGTPVTDATLSGANYDGADFTSAYIAEDVPVPDGWLRDSDSGKLRRAAAKSNQPATASKMSSCPGCGAPRH